MSKYILVSISGVMLQIAKQKPQRNYTEGVLEAFLPDEGELNEEEQKEWIKENNKRMEAICKFLNDNDL